MTPAPAPFPTRICHGLRAIATAGFTRYLLANALTLATATLLRATLALALPFHATVVGAYGLSIIAGYHFMRWLKAFPETGRPMLHDLIRMSPVIALSLIVLTTVSTVFRDLVLPMAGLSWRVDDIAYLIGALSTPLPNYLLMRWLLTPSRGKPA